MKPCESMRETLVELHYGLVDAGQEDACRQHLAGCPACAAELESLTRLVGALRAGEAFSRENEVDWDRFARITVKRAVGRRLTLLPGVRRWQLPQAFRLPASPAWAAAASLLVVISLGLVAYNYLPFGLGPSGGPGRGGLDTTIAEGGPKVRMPALNIDNLTVNLARQNTAQYLNETRAVLVTLMDVNIHCEKERVDISAERAKATELLRRQRLIAAELNRLPLARAQDVCDDLEKLLLEVASLADCTHDDEIQTLRDVVEKRQILVRMELLSQELARREGAHV